MADSEQSGAQAAPPPPATLGEMLRVARLAQDLTVEQLATELRIEAKQLNALENNRFEQIGVPVFVKGYLKQYGLRLGLDVRDLLALYYKQTTLADVEIQPNRTIKLRDERQITSWILAAVVLLVVGVGLAVWWWSGGNFGIVQGTPAAAPPPTEEAERNESPAAPPTLAPPERTLPVADPVPPPPVDPGQPETAQPETPAVAAVEREAGDGDARAGSAVSVPLELTFDGESWAEVTDARGQRLLFGLNAAGRSVTVSGEPPFAIVLGDANAVRLTVDGSAYEIPRAGRQGNLVRFSVGIDEE
jgi:cytoskeleton protein RodZ